MLVIDECTPRVRSDTRFGDFDETMLQIENATAGVPDQNEIIDCLHQVASQIRTLVLGRDSQLIDLQILAHLPLVSRVVLWSAQVRNLSGLTQLPTLRELVVAVNSRKRSLSILPSLALHDLHVVVTSEGDVAPIAKVDVNRLHVNRWPKPDLTDLDAARIEELRIESAKLETIDRAKPLRRLWLQGCSRLRFFSHVVADDVEIDSCNNVDLPSLANVSQMQSLVVRSRKTIRSLDFVPLCSDLKWLEFRGMSLRGLDVSPIGKSDSLRYLSADLTREQEQLLLQLNPDLGMVTSDDVLVLDGKKVGNIRDIDLTELRRELTGIGNE